MNARASGVRSTEVLYGISSNPGLRLLREGFSGPGPLGSCPLVLAFCNGLIMFDLPPPKKTRKKKKFLL
jgi:hypothetical protein